MGPCTAEIALRLAESHIKRYTGYLQLASLGRGGIKVEECKQLVGIWKAIQLAASSPHFVATKLPQAQRYELFDALADES